VFWFIVVHIGLPLGFGVVFFIINAATAPAALNWPEICVETALDLGILSLGTTGAVFDSKQVEMAFGPNAAILAICVVVVNLIFSGLIVLAKSRVVRKNMSFTVWHATITLFLGVLSLGATGGTLVWAYTLGRA